MRNEICLDLIKVVVAYWKVKTPCHARVGVNSVFAIQFQIQFR